MSRSTVRGSMIRSIGISVALSCIWFAPFVACLSISKPGKVGRFSETLGKVLFRGTMRLTPTWQNGTDLQFLENIEAVWPFTIDRRVDSLRVTRPPSPLRSPTSVPALEDNMPTVTEALHSFLQARRKSHNGPDLLDRWTPAMETQVNVAAGRGEPVAGKRNTFGDGVNQWWNIRIPKNAHADPEFHDYKMTWPLDLHADAIGCTGWDWQARPITLGWF